MHIAGKTDDHEYLTLRRHYRFYFHEVAVYSGQTLVGHVRRNFAICSRDYTLLDARG